MRLLLIEDDERLAPVVVRGLDRAGFTVDRMATVGDAREALLSAPYDLVVLDLGLPDGDGLNVLRELRGREVPVPVLILTARDAVENRVDGLDAGADDYLLKPFAMEELIARLRALLRRAPHPMSGWITVGNVRFESVERTVEISGLSVLLSRRELSLFELLMQRAGNVMLKEGLEDRIYEFDAEPSSNSLEVLVHRLRRKLVENGATATIHTVRGVGYLLSEDAP